MSPKGWVVELAINGGEAFCIEGSRGPKSAVPAMNQLEAGNLVRIHRARLKRGSCSGVTVRMVPIEAEFVRPLGDHHQTILR